MKKKKGIVLLVTAAMSINLLSACGSVGNDMGADTSENQIPESETSEMPEEQLAAGDGGEAFMQKLHGMYDEIETEYRPDVRWWLAEGLNTDDTLEKNTQQIKDFGFGAAEFLAMPEPGADSSIYGWGSEEWTSDTRLIIEKATELGLGFSLTSGTHWANANLPDTYTWDGAAYNPDNRAASKELDYATVYLKAGERMQGELPTPVRPEDVAGDFHGSSAVYQELEFQGVVTAKLIEGREEAGADYEYAEGTGTGVLDFNSLKDISEYVSEQDGTYTLDWTAPADGDYAVFVYWMHGTGQTATPSVSTNYTVNYIDSYGIDALIDYWEEVVLSDELKETIRENGRGEIYMDSLELTSSGAGGLLWGYNLKEEFMERMGYDITPYLPVLTGSGLMVMTTSPEVFDYTGEGEEAQQTIEKIHNDYYRVMSDMYEENVLRPLQDWLKTLNMSLRAEPSYGVHFEISTPAKYLDDVETESFAQNGEIDLYRGLLGSANMYGRLFSSETGALRGHNYYYSLDDLTQLCYLQFVNGVNRTVFHGYSAIEGSGEDTYWPGHEGMYARQPERISNRQPVAKDYQDWTQMLGRDQKVLRQGTASRDIAILRTDYRYICYGFPDEYNGFYKNRMLSDEAYFYQDMSLQQAGYTYDYFAPALLEDEENVSWTAEELQPNGAGYKAMVIYQDMLGLSSAEKILEIAKDGLPIVFVNNCTESNGDSDPASVYEEAASKSDSLTVSDEELQAVVAEIKALDNVSVVDSIDETMSALQNLGVYPRVAFSEANNQILTISRNDRENNIYYTLAYAYKFTEEESDAYTVNLEIEGEGAPYSLNDWTGEITKIGNYEIKDGKTCVPVSLRPGEAVIIALNLAEGEEKHAVSSTADEVRMADGRLMLLATKGGEYETVLSSGETVNYTIEVPEEIVIPAWDITIEDWNEGEKVVNTEEKFGHVTTEVYYTTKKTELTFENSELMAWKDLPATEEQLALLGYEDASMEHISGIGTYEASFTLPENWTENNGAFFTIENAFGGSVAVYVNGEKADAVNCRTLKVDVSDLLQEGENTIKVEISTSLTNRMLQRNYEEKNAAWTEDFPTIQSYGMTGKTAIVPYTLQAVE